MKKVFLIVGESGSGKSTLVNELEQRGYSSVQSFTTRPPRFEGERGHIFCTVEKYEQFKEAGEIVAYTFFSGNHYFATMSQLLLNDLYVIDNDGIQYLKEKVKDIEFITIYIKTSEETRIERMYKRGDTEKMVDDRLFNDYHKFKDLDFDYAVPNENLQLSTDMVEFIIRRNRMEV